MSERDSEREPLAEGSLLSHLIELRDRLLRSFVAVSVVFLAIVGFSNRIYTFVATPLLQKLPKGASMIATSLTAPFLEPIKLAFFCALFLAMPYVLYQVWAFV